MIRLPQEGEPGERPDRVVPILSSGGQPSAEGLLGEISLWGGAVPLPPADDPLLQNFAIQAARALERIKKNGTTDKTGG